MDNKYRVYLLGFYSNTDVIDNFTDFDSYKAFLPHFDCMDETEMNDIVYMLTELGDYKVTVEKIEG